MVLRLTGRSNRAIISICRSSNTPARNRDKRFEWLVLSSSKDAPRCPSCESDKFWKSSFQSLQSVEETELLLRLPAGRGPVGSDATDPQGSGSCSLNSEMTFLSVAAESQDGATDA